MRLIALALVLLLAACVSPRDPCAIRATSEQRVLTRLASDTRANIARGFALETRQEVREVRATCETELPDGTIANTRCTEVKVEDVRVPVAVDLDAEQTKLNSLETRLRDMIDTAKANQAQCLAVTPAG
ncbi:MAG: hypothetical protein ABF248_00955 [Yoonia sp.]